MDLFNEEDSECEDSQFKTDTEYAKKYDTWRKKEELHKLKTKYGEDATLDNSDSSSSSSEDDEDNALLDEKFNKGFFKVMAALKTKDPKIYDRNIKFFEDDSDEQEVKKKPKKEDKKEKKIPFDSYTGEVLKYEGNLEEIKQQPSKKINQAEELNKLCEDSDSEDELLLKKPTAKTNEDNVYKEKKLLENLYKGKNASKEDQFLYNHIIAQLPNNDVALDEDDNHTTQPVDHSDDDEVDEKLEEYEHKYNFRFEEPDPEFIKRYPRTIEFSMRQKDNKRKLKREERKERKQREKEEKMEEIRQLQAFKLKEIEEKISKLKQVTGKTEVAFNPEDLDGDFDPDEYDRRMQALFNDEFYKGPEDEQKPEFPDLDEELEIENWQKLGTDGYDEKGGDKEGESELHCEDAKFNMDCDYDPEQTQKELIESSRGKKKRKRKSKFAEVLTKPKPLFDPNDKSYQEYLDEYYKLDCEDIIGDVKCRFKYRETIPNSYGLSIEEILAANDRELNRWCSIKKTMMHMPDHVEKYDVIAFQKKGENLALKKRVLPSIFQEETVDATVDKKGNTGENMIGTSMNQKGDNKASEEAENAGSKKKRKRDKKGQNLDNSGGNTEIVGTNGKNIEKNAENIGEDTGIIGKDAENIGTNAEVNRSSKGSNKTKRKQIEMITEHDELENIETKNQESDEKCVNLGDNLKAKKKKSKNKTEVAQDELSDDTTQTPNEMEAKTSNDEAKTSNDEAKSGKKKKKGKQQNEAEMNTQDLEQQKSKSSKKRKATADSEYNKVKKFKFDNNKRKNEKKGKKNAEENPMGISDARLKAYGINPKKFKNKLKYKN